MKRNAEIIKQIIASVDITGRKELLLHGKPAVSYREDIYSRQPSGKMLFDQLHQLIYRAFYIQPGQPRSKTLPAPSALATNLALLSRANQGTEQFDEGWRIEKNEEGGTLLARKGNRLTRLVPGEFLNMPRGTKRDEEREVKIFRPREYGDIRDIFYYAYGRAVDESNGGEGVRFYFNTSFEGNRKWMNLLTRGLDQFDIPFIFKCLIHPFFYDRSDTAVLYCNRQYAGFVYDLIDSVYGLAGKHSRPGLPLFLYPLRKGIGFAEQPGNENESFGTHWSKIIAAGIMKAFEEGLPKEKWLQEVMQHIQDHHGYGQPELFYRNPGGRYPYPFIRNEK